MEEENKLPLKRVELSLTKFNEVAIPHHLDLLRQHKANIVKYEESGQYARVRAEQTHARRVAAQLRALLQELGALRRQVRAEDVPRFDRRTERARELTRRAIADYLESAPMAIPSPAADEPCAGSTESVGLVAHCEPADEPCAGSTESVGLVAHEPGGLLAHCEPPDERELQLRAREAALRGWAELHADVRALHEAWALLGAAALAAREPVRAADERVGAAAADVRAARGALAAAERLRAGAWGACGALAGALLGGPAGVLLGAKAGLAVGLAAGGLGYLGGAGLARARRALPPPAAPQDKDR
ncbi:syntaxin-17 isoform X4 [Bicyclus anynana]|uniref:Syntaxin-17 isoform X4 n=1 Tax=Bicyclus anynana TaxID=110368 RepID=A0A6J1NY65_BICAN|nr:syntaxin-17 isoform X4 [Bicyclus anynana]